MEKIYSNYREPLDYTMNYLITRIQEYNDVQQIKTGHRVYEHLSYRIKSIDSMRAKCERKGLPENAYSALFEIKDSVGIRIVTRFISDIYTLVSFFKSLENCEVVNEKDYISNVKPNGYRSYHLIVKVKTPFEDVLGNVEGEFFAEIQIRTIAMDTWASLEHEMKYKRSLKNQDMIVSELKRCADELASCDLTMQTLRDLIRADEI